MKKIVPLAFLLTVALDISYPSLDPAAQGQTTLRTQAQPGAREDVSDTELRAFAKSYVEFYKIRTDYEPRLSVARTTEEKGKLQQEAVAKFDAALEREGLTMARYGVLYQTVSADPRLLAKTLKLIEEERAKS